MSLGVSLNCRGRTWTVNVAKFGTPFALYLPRLFASLRTLGAPGVGLNPALFQVAAKLLRQTVITAQGLLFPGDALALQVGGIGARPTRFSSLGHAFVPDLFESLHHGGPPEPSPSRRACEHRNPMALCARFAICRRSSGVERAIGNGEAGSSILSGGTIFSKTYKIFYKD